MSNLSTQRVYEIAQLSRSHVDGTEPFKEEDAERLLLKHLKKSETRSVATFSVDRITFSTKRFRSELFYRDIKQFFRCWSIHGVFMLYVKELKTGVNAFESYKCIDSNEVSDVQSLITSAMIDKANLLRETTRYDTRVSYQPEVVLGHEPTIYSTNQNLSRSFDRIYERKIPDSDSEFTTVERSRPRENVIKIRDETRVRMTPPNRTHSNNKYSNIYSDTRVIENGVHDSHFGGEMVMVSRRIIQPQNFQRQSSYPPPGIRHHSFYQPQKELFFREPNTSPVHRHGLKRQTFAQDGNHYLSRNTQIKQSPMIQSWKPNQYPSRQYSTQPMTYIQPVQRKSIYRSPTRQSQMVYNDTYYKQPVQYRQNITSFARKPEVVTVVESPKQRQISRLPRREISHSTGSLRQSSEKYEIRYLDSSNDQTFISQVPIRRSPVMVTDRVSRTYEPVVRTSMMTRDTGNTSDHGGDRTVSTVKNASLIHLDPFAEDGPKISERGAVYMYADRVEHSPVRRLSF